MNRLLISLLVAGAFSVTAIQAQDKIENCGPAADMAAFIIDMSGSMMQDYVFGNKEKQITVQKSVAAQDVVRRIIHRLNEKTKMPISVSSVAPYAKLILPNVYGNEDLDEQFKKLNHRLEEFGRPTWLGKRIVERLTTAQDVTESLILVTDGGFSESDPGNSARLGEVIKKYGEVNPDSCIHIISAAQTEPEKEIIETIGDILTCTQIAELSDLQTEKAINQFVENALWKDCPPRSVVPLAPIELNNCIFDFDKFNLNQEAVVALNQAIDKVRAVGEFKHLRFVGWTDATGSDDYNRRLSENRARAVMQYFVSKGFDPEKLSSNGQGKSFKYDNKTVHGRAMNRRVDIEIR